MLYHIWTRKKEKYFTFYFSNRLTWKNKQHQQQQPRNKNMWTEIGVEMKIEIAIKKISLNAVTVSILTERKMQSNYRNCIALYKKKSRIKFHCILTFAICAKLFFFWRKGKILLEKKNNKIKRKEIQSVICWECFRFLSHSSNKLFITWIYY